MSVVRIHQGSPVSLWSCQSGLMARPAKPLFVGSNPTLHSINKQAKEECRRGPTASLGKRMAEQSARAFESHIFHQEFLTVAQSDERRITNPEVAGSIPAGGSSLQRGAGPNAPHGGRQRELCVAPALSGCIVSPVRRPALEAGSRRFKSCHPDQIYHIAHYALILIERRSA